MPWRDAGEFLVFGIGHLSPYHLSLAGRWPVTHCSPALLGRAKAALLILSCLTQASAVLLLLLLLLLLLPPF